MASVVSLAGSLGLLLVSALPEVLGDRPNPDRRAHPGDAAQLSPGATETRRRRQPPPPKNQRERTWAGALPLGVLYTAAAVAFVLYKCLQGKDEATFLQEEAGKKDSLQSEQQLAQLTQQLAQTEQHLNSLMAQLEPLFERVTTLAGAQQELLHMKLQAIHQLLQESKSNKGVEVPEPEASTPFPEDLCIEEDEEEAGDSQAWEEPLSWSTGMRNLATPREMEQGLRRRCQKAAAKGPVTAPTGKEGQQLTV
ncbi:coiled-coil domain-containing protein 107 isoform X2 [Physeter macrocephalus]|uniref:Coiled-coil domain-containing protein 107 isoform X2 n=1 Tax=Physeter macrocephalus TaxID=9755 RepID=A0A2Y9EUK1_PHYMC|nr:coiled-coil domain-containing protein 107 isoform X2 [Physeter catodon]|eukprot:XP_007108610.2 coiled-coil domain-containing protein 107 isoform X2 [Physeter catodon]